LTVTNVELESILAALEKKLSKTTLFSLAAPPPSPSKQIAEE
jgi:hypothetical protein